MLILTRRVGETIKIGDNVSVTVLGMNGRQIRIGIAAPKSIAVHRKEVFERIQRENQALAPTSTEGANSEAAEPEDADTPTR